jgi:hypothetical protein
MVIANLVVVLLALGEDSMLRTQAKSYLLIGLLLGILSFVLGCVSIANSNEKYPAEKSPIRTLSIQINEDQREELFVQVQKISEKHNLKFNLSFYENERVFFIEMYGKGLEILALSKPVNTTDLDINFYEQDPTNPPSQEVVDELLDDLKTFISEIPNVTITEEK